MNDEYLGRHVELLKCLCSLIQISFGAIFCNSSLSLVLINCRHLPYLSPLTMFHMGPPLFKHLCHVWRAHNIRATFFWMRNRNFPMTEANRSTPFGFPPRTPSISRESSGATVPCVRQNALSSRRELNARRCTCVCRATFNLVPANFDVQSPPPPPPWAWAHEGESLWKNYSLHLASFLSTASPKSSRRSPSVHCHCPILTKSGACAPDLLGVNF
jgi:hypothetical protein